MSLIELIDNQYTDKNSTHSYLPLYEKILKNKKNIAKNILEIGIGDFGEKNGGSIKLWKDYFKNATIYGLDILPINRVMDELLNNDRVILYTSIDAYNNDFFTKNFLNKKIKFDFMLDDGPHTLESMKQFIKLYSQIMTVDGVLIIEDVQSLEWIDLLKNEVPQYLKKYIKIYDLRKNKNRYDDIVFTIDKTNIIKSNNSVQNNNIMDIEIYGVYFICCKNNYLEIVEEQLDILQKGLLGVTTKLIIFITNYNDSCKNLDILLKKYKTKKFILVKSPDNLYEKFAINNYKNYINSKKEYYLYYFHTKGVSRINDPFFSNIRKRLNFYTLEKFKINIKLLKKYDSIGCSLSLYPKNHFSGNFWWSKSSYLKLLTTINDKYLSPEMYILSNEKCNYISLANDTNYIQDKYVFRNNKEILKNITKEFINNEQHKYLDI